MQNLYFLKMVFHLSFFKILGEGETQYMKTPGFEPWITHLQTSHIQLLDLKCHIPFLLKNKAKF